MWRRFDESRMLLVFVGLLMVFRISSAQETYHDYEYEDAPWHFADVTGTAAARLLEDDGVTNAITGALGHNLLNPYLDYAADEAGPENQEPWFPGCPVFDGVNKEAKRGCNFIRYFKDVLTSIWVNFSRTGSTTRPLNPNGWLPQPLADHRPNPPKQVGQASIYKERPTYYFCYRLILLLYTIAFEYESSGMKIAIPQLLDDWQNQKTYMVGYFKARGSLLKKLPPQRSPLAVSMLKGEKMLIVIRGTIFLDEWCKDFQYRWAKDEAQLFPGRTHEGMYSVLREFYQDLEAEVQRVKPSYILVTGHSLGAGLANMIGFRLQNMMGYQPRVDVIGFGGPNTGDAIFAEEFKKTVNSRHVIFLGRGREPNSALYSAGDITAQYTCNPYPACGVLDTGPSGRWYDYKRPHNQVPFYPEEMPNPERWQKESNLKRIPSMKGIIASHLCSYICWTSQSVGDLDSRCHFADEKGRPDLPRSYLCDVSQMPI